MEDLCGKLDTKVEFFKERHQQILDEKLGELSKTLDEIKSNQKELLKYRNLLRSLSTDLSNEQ